MDNRVLAFNEELVQLRVDASTSLSVLKTIAKLLMVGGYVKDTYEQAIIAREKIYPTGLPTEPFGVAVPHTDTEHVNRPAIAIVTLKKPVIFQQMGAPEVDVSVQIVFALAITDKDAQIKILEQLTEAFQDQRLMQRLMDASSAEEVVHLLTANSEAL